MSLSEGENGPGQHPWGTAKIGLLWAWLPKCGVCPRGGLQPSSLLSRLCVGEEERVPAVLLCSEPGRLSEVMSVLREFVVEGKTLRFGVL